MSDADAHYWEGHAMDAEAERDEWKDRAKAAEARIEAVLTLQDEYEKRGYLLGGTIAEVRAALAGEADDAK